MKNRRHKRRESYSVLFVSNIDRRNRHFRITRSTLHLLVILVLLIVVAAVFFGYQTFRNIWQENIVQQQLHDEQLAELQLISEQEAEKNVWAQEKQALEQEIETLRAELTAREQEIQAAADAAAEAAKEAEREAELAMVPTLYPSSGVGVLTATFSVEHPYISFTVEAGTDIIAAGDGTVLSISSDDTYHHIIEVVHESGYTTRYLYRQNAELKVQEGAQVRKGDPLLTITSENTELDYEVLYEGESIDPLSIIAAKG